MDYPGAVESTGKHFVEPANGSTGDLRGKWSDPMNKSTVVPGHWWSGCWLAQVGDQPLINMYASKFFAPDLWEDVEESYQCKFCYQGWYAYPKEPAHQNKEPSASDRTVLTRSRFFELFGYEN